MEVILWNGFVTEQVLLEFWDAVKLVVIFLVVVDLLKQSINLQGWVGDSHVMVM